MFCEAQGWGWWVSEWLRTQHDHSVYVVTLAALALCVYVAAMLEWQSGSENLQCRTSGNLAPSEKWLTDKRGRKMECYSVPISLSFFVIFDMLVLTCGGYMADFEIKHSEETVKWNRWFSILALDFRKNRKFKIPL